MVELSGSVASDSRRVTLQEVQKERETNLAELLLERIEPYIKGDKGGFTTWAQSEAHQLAEAGKAPPCYLDCIMWCRRLHFVQ